MFKIFTDFDSWVTYTILDLSPDTKLGDALHFFIEDVTKIFALLLVMIYFVALQEAQSGNKLPGSQPVEQQRSSISERHQFAKDETREIFGRVWK